MSVHGPIRIIEDRIELLLHWIELKWYVPNDQSIIQPAWLMSVCCVPTTSDLARDLSAWSSIVAQAINRSVLCFLSSSTHLPSCLSSESIALHPPTPRTPCWVRASPFFRCSASKCSYKAFSRKQRSLKFRRSNRPAASELHASQLVNIPSSELTGHWHLWTQYINTGLSFYSYILSAHYGFFFTLTLAWRWYSQGVSGWIPWLSSTEDIDVSREISRQVENRVGIRVLSEWPVSKYGKVTEDRVQCTEWT